MTITAIQPLTTASAPANGTPANVAQFTSDWTLKIRVIGLAQGSTARFTFTETLNNFANALAGPSFSFAGGFGGYADEVRSIKKCQFPDSYFGRAGAQTRLDLTNITGGGAVSYQAWIEQ